MPMQRHFRADILKLYQREQKENDSALKYVQYYKYAQGTQIVRKKHLTERVNEPNRFVLDIIVTGFDCLDHLLHGAQIEVDDKGDVISGEHETGGLFGVEHGHSDQSECLKKAEAPSIDHCLLHSDVPLKDVNDEMIFIIPLFQKEHCRNFQAQLFTK